MWIITWSITLVSIVALFWIYIGYAVSVWLMGRWMGPEPRMQNDHLPSVTVIIPTHNEARTIRQKVENTLAADYPPELLEILIIDDASTDQTITELLPFIGQHIRWVVKEQRSGKANSIILGLAASISEVIVVTDADVLIHPNSLRLLSHRLNDPKVGAVSGLMDTTGSAQTGMAASTGMFWRLENLILKNESRIDSQTYLLGSLFAATRATMMRFPVDEHNVSEDFDLAVRIRRSGLRIVTEPKAMFSSVVPSNANDVMKQRSRTALGTIQTLWKHRSCIWNPRYGFFGLVALPSHKLGQVLSPLLVSIALVGSTSSTYFQPQMVVVFLSTCILIGIVSISITVHNFKPRFIAQAVLYIILLQWIMIVAWWKFWRRDIQVAWQQIGS